MKDDFIFKLKSSLDIVDVVSAYLDLKKLGSNYKGLCPFHAEKTPSFVVSQEKQIFRCFGCGASGDIISFVSRIEGLDFKETVSKLAELAGLELPYSNNKKNNTDRYEEFYKITTLSKIFFSESLKQSVTAKEYLKNRQISDDIITEFGIGYAPDSWDSLYRYISSQKLSFTKASELGLLSKKNKGYYDVYRNRIMFPIFNIYGQVLAFGGRTLSKDTKQAKYINSKASIIYDKSKNLYGLYQSKKYIRQAGYAIVVEGYVDLLSLFGAGVKNVVATLGTAFTKEQAELLKRFTGKVVMLYDGDNAGVNAAKKSLKILLEQNFVVKAVFLEDGLDPDEFIKQNGVEALKDKLSKADDLLGIVINEFFMQAGLTSEKLEALKSSLEYLASVQDSISLDLWLDKLSSYSGISVANVKKHLGEYKKSQNKTKKRVMVQSNVKVEVVEPMYKYFVKAIIEKPDLAYKVFDNEFEKFLPNQLTNFAKLVRDNFNEIERNKQDFFTNLIHSVPDWISTLITEELLDNSKELGRSFAREFDAVIRRFNIAFLEKKKKDCLLKLKDHETTELLEEYRELLSDIRRLREGRPINE